MSTIRESEAVAGPTAAPRPAERRQGVVPRGPAALLALQRAAGNRAVAAAVQQPAARAGAAAPPAVGAELASAAPELAAPENVAERAAAASAPPAPPAPPAPGGGGTTVQRGILDDIADAAGEALDSARRSALTAVTDYAKRIPGYGLLCTVLGKDVITDAPVDRSAAKLIDGFLGLIPGSERIRQNLQESRATEKAGQWLEEEVPKLGLSWEVIKGLFQRAWDALSITDLADPETAFRKIQGIFSGPLGRLRDFAVAAGKKLLEFVFEGALSLAGSAGDAVMGIIRRAGGVFEQIVADPMRFLGNLVNAVRGGLSAFMTNVGSHLKNGLVAWLTGSLGGVIRLPEKFDLKGILGMVLDFLGLTWSRVKGKLGRLIGTDVLEMLETGVDKLQKGAGFIGDLFKRGLSAITDRIAEFASGLVGQVMDGIRDWVARSVVGAAITKLISMFNPAGAVIQAIISIYNTVQFFIERGKQIAALAGAVFDSIAEIASGNIGRAVQWVEQALARAVPVVLGFLARLIGLGDIAEPVRNVMKRVQSVVDQALDKAMEWVARVGAPIINMVKKVAGRIRAGVDAGRAWVRGRVEAVGNRVGAGVRALGERLGLVRHRFRAGSDEHTLSVNSGGHVLMASGRPKPVAEKVGQRYDVVRARVERERRLGRPVSRDLPPRESFVSRVVAVVAEAERRISAAGEQAPAAARSAFDRIAPVVSDLLVQISASAPGEESPAEAGVVPNIGRIAPWGSNKDANRTDPDETRHLEAEHVIDHEFLSLAVVDAGFERLTADDKERQHTIMIYRTAAAAKNRGVGGAYSLRSSIRNLFASGMPTLGGLNATTRRRKGGREAVAEWRERSEERAPEIRAAFREKAGRFLGALVGSLAQVVRLDHPGKEHARSHQDVRPTEDQIRRAAELQVLDVVDSLRPRGPS